MALDQMQHEAVPWDDPHHACVGDVHMVRESWARTCGLNLVGVFQRVCFREYGKGSSPRGASEKVCLVECRILDLVGAEEDL
jgi:hypothetical protein